MKFVFLKGISYVAVDGGWCAYEDAQGATCSETCGNGLIDQRRVCECPAQAFGGDPCSGDDTQEAVCNLGPCPGTNYISIFSSFLCPKCINMC